MKIKLINVFLYTNLNLDMRGICLFLFLFVICFLSSLKAQNVITPLVGSQLESSINATPKIDSISGALRPYLFLRANPERHWKKDTISFLYEKYFGELEQMDDSIAAIRYLPSRPQYHRLFTPLAFYFSPMAHYSSMNWEVPYFESVAVSLHDPLVDDDGRFVSWQSTNALVDETLMAIYLNSPHLIITTETSIMSRQSYREDVIKEDAHKDKVLKLFQTEPIEVQVGESNILIHKPNWWVFGGNSSIQLAQNYISDNWYKGGDSNVALSTNLQLFANYNDREKIQWENLLEAKVSFNSSPSDKYHKILFTTDQLRLYSKLGLQAHKNWYYTATAEFKTQFFNGYKANSEELVSAILAPADVNVSIGMDYKLKKPKVTLSVFLAPLTYNMRYVGNKRVDEVKFGLEEGHSTHNSFGSQITPTMSWKIIPAITWDTRLDFTTSYSWTRIEWENTFNFVLNQIGRAHV